MEPLQQALDTDLIRSFQEGNQQALETLINRYKEKIFSSIFFLVKDKYLAEDLFQEVFIKVIDTLRSKGFQNNKQNRELTENVHDSAGSTQTMTDKIGLRKLVHQLKEEHKVLIELSYFQGFTQDEISKMLDLPLGTVKTRLRTALSQLRQIIK